MNDGWLALLQQALNLLFSLDPEVWSIIYVSFSVSFAALLITLIRRWYSGSYWHLRHLGGSG